MRAEMAKVEERQFQAETKKPPDLMIHSLYTSKEIFLRELISKSRLCRGRVDIEAGATQFEEWGPMPAEIAIKLSVPTSRLISETGKFAQASQREGQCGHLVTRHRERRAMS
jgi:molecular chaperone HtpG